MTTSRDVLLGRARTELLDRLASTAQSAEMNVALDAYDESLCEILQIALHDDDELPPIVPLPPLPLPPLSTTAYRSRDQERAFEAIVQISRDATHAIVEIFYNAQRDESDEPKDES